MISAARFGARSLSLVSRTQCKSRALVVRTMASNSYHILNYTYVGDILEKRGPYRADHLEGAKKMAAQQKLVMAGAVGNPVDGATFVFKNVTEEEIKKFVESDPYVVNGLVPSWSVKPYTVVVGDSD